MGEKRLTFVAMKNFHNNEELKEFLYSEGSADKNYYDRVKRTLVIQNTKDQEMLREDIFNFLISEITYKEDTFVSDICDSLKSNEIFRSVYIMCLQDVISSIDKDIAINCFLFNKNKRFKKELKILKFAKYLVNGSPNELTPTTFSKKVKNFCLKFINDDTKMDVNIIDDIDDISKFGLLYGVGKGSNSLPRIVHIRYTGNIYKTRNVIVGKGITYDTGGLSLKPTNSMINMRSDKAGAAYAVGIFLMCVLKNPKMNYDVVIPLAENAIGPGALRPGDILTSYGKNPVTVEIKNTDAEGRLVLADAITYIQEEIEKDNDVIGDFVELSTLTGAAASTLGPGGNAVYTNNIIGFNSLKYKGTKYSDTFVSFPYNRNMKNALKSEFADIINTSNEQYGSIMSAGMFLMHFVKDENKDKFIHIDIAPSAFNNKKTGFYPKGASGCCIRSVSDYICGAS